jgi:putative CocE/NonD family hydrolase
MKVQEIMIEMRDGISLQNFIYFPEGNAPFPSLLARCTYGHAVVVEVAKFWVEKGYVVVLQNIRGRHKSEGGPVTRNDHPEDGYDTMDWIITQSWSNQVVGTFGRSALAKVQIATAFLAHPAHRAMAPEVLPYGFMSRLGGAFMFSQVPQWMYLAQSGTELGKYEAVEWMPHLFKLPVTSTLDGIGGPIGRYKEIIRSYGMKEDMSPEKIENLMTPNLMVTGWYDHCSPGPIDFFMQTMELASEEQKQNTHLVIGPWDHSVDGDAANEYDFGPDSKLNLRETENEFFEKHLKDKKSIKPFPPVRLFVMGRNEWRDELEWPLSRAKDTNFYLHSDGNVTGAWIKGSLSTEPPKDEKFDTFTYDPANPVPTWGGANSSPAIALPMKRGARDQQITLFRKDVLTYYSDPLTEPFEVTGMLKMVLYASSSAKDTDFTAKLMDIGLDGNARLLSDGIIRARFRNSETTPENINPGEVYRYEIDLWFTSNEFLQGHRIGLAISSSNFPRINRNLNTGGDNEQDSDFIQAKQTIFHNSKYPSHLILPVIKDN